MSGKFWKTIGIMANQASILSPDNNKAVGFFKNTFSKITGFIKGKPAKPKTDQEEKVEDKAPEVKRQIIL